MKNEYKNAKNALKCLYKRKEITIVISFYSKIEVKVLLISFKSKLEYKSSK